MAREEQTRNTELHEGPVVVHLVPRLKIVSPVREHEPEYDQEDDKGKRRDKRKGERSDEHQVLYNAISTVTYSHTATYS
jgi:hypothetical protein